MDEQAIEVTAAVITRTPDRAAGTDGDGGTEVLIALRRPGAPRGGLWEFPGGKVRPGESDEDALAREIREELGIVISVGRLTDTVRWTYPDVVIELRAYACTLRSGTPIALEHDEVRWVRVSDLGLYAFAGADVSIAERLGREQEQRTERRLDGSDAR
ncbi:MAG: (deoxy)nucleoside triphosphate pyrophosphohydrolase [Spirochaetota bacterium]